MSDAWLRFLEEVNTIERWHNRRYLESLHYLFERNVLMPGCEVAELGGEGSFTGLVRRFGSGVNVTSLKEIDLRYLFFPGEDYSRHVPDISFDLVLCMEVMEHVRDQDPASIEEAATFSGNGIEMMLRESFRILRAGGYLFVTTPNVCSLKNLEQLLDHVHPYFFEPHHRELSVRDVRKFGEAAGFVTREIVTKNVWNYHGMSEEKIKHLRNVLAFAGSSQEDREDDIFALFQKPADPIVATGEGRSTN